MKPFVPSVIAAAVICGCADPRDTVAPPRERIVISALPAPAAALPLSGVLTLGEAQRIARENNPDLRATLHLVNAAKMRYYQSLGAYLPTVTAQFDLEQTLVGRSGIIHPLESTVERENIFDVAVGMRATWLLFDGFSRELEVLIRRRGELYARANRENVLRKLDRAVACTYCDVMLAEVMRAIADADIAFQASALAQAQSRHASGFIARSDLLGFKIDLERARLRLIRADESKRLARCALSCLLGYPAGELPEQLAVSPVPDELPQLELSSEFYLDEALNNRPDLEMERALVAIRNFTKRQALSAFLPRVRAGSAAGYLGRGDATRDHGTSLFRAFDEVSFGFGIGADWTIFNGFARYNRYRELREMYEEAKLALAGKELEVMLEVESACAVFRSLAAQAKCLCDMQQWVLEQRDLVNAEYWAGNVTITRLRGAQSDLVTAQSRYAGAVIELCKASAQLNAATGGSGIAWQKADAADLLLERIARCLEKEE